MPLHPSYGVMEMNNVEKMDGNLSGDVNVRNETAVRLVVDGIMSFNQAAEFMDLPEETSELVREEIVKRILSAIKSEDCKVNRSLEDVAEEYAKVLRTRDDIREMIQEGIRGKTEPYAEGYAQGFPIGYAIGYIGEAIRNITLIVLSGHLNLEKAIELVDIPETCLDYIRPMVCNRLCGAYMVKKSACA